MQLVGGGLGVFVVSVVLIQIGSEGVGTLAVWEWPRGCCGDFFSREGGPVGGIFLWEALCWSGLFFTYAESRAKFEPKSSQIRAKFEPNVSQFEPNLSQFEPV